jgi:hypothetical protein
MTVRTLAYSLAAAAMTVAATAHGAAPLSAARSSAAVSEADELGGGSDFLPVLIFMAAIVAMVLVVDGDNDDLPASP